MSAPKPPPVGFAPAFLGLSPGSLAVFLCVYLLAHLGLRMLAPDWFHVDELEQADLSLSPAWGYTLQPPLYTWLVWAASHLFGFSLFSLAFVRFAILSVMYLFVALSVRLVSPDGRLVLPATLALLVVPFFAWDVVHHLTHSALLAAAIAVTLFFFLRLAQTGRTRDYLGLGAALGLGFLAKYNYEVFAVSLIAAGLTVAETRRRLVNVRFLLTLGLAGLLVLPHVMWVLGHWHGVSGGLSMRAGVGARDGYFAVVMWGVGRLALSSLLTAAPLGVLVVFFGRPRRVDATGDTGIATRLLDRYLISLGVVLLLHVVFGGVTRFQPRWLSPLLIPAPLWFFLRVPASKLGTARVRLFGTLVAAAMVLVLIGRGVVLFQETSNPGQDRPAIVKKH